MSLARVGCDFLPISLTLSLYLDTIKLPRGADVHPVDHLPDGELARPLRASAVDRRAARHGHDHYAHPHRHVRLRETGWTEFVRQAVQSAVQWVGTVGPVLVSN